MANALKEKDALQSSALSPEQGEVWLGSRGVRVTLRSGSVAFTELLEGRPSGKGGAEASPPLKKALAQLGEYLQGRRKSFEVPLFLEGPPFYRAVWEALRKVPYGSTVSYGELAALAGRPGAARAVGSAMNRNPAAILVPCHRVTASQGKLGGFACGIEWKKFLLALEGGSALEFKP